MVLLCNRDRPGLQVFYDVDRLRARWRQIMPILDIVEEAHDYQAAVVLQKSTSSNVHSTHKTPE